MAGEGDNKIVNEPVQPPSNIDRIIAAIEAGFRRVDPPPPPVAVDPAPLLETYQPGIQAAGTAATIGAFLVSSASALGYIMVNFFNDTDTRTLVAFTVLYCLVTGALGYFLFRCVRRRNP